MTKKEELYYLISAYNKGEYDIQTFCQTFEQVFYPDIPYEELTPLELDAFQKLGEKVARFSPFEEDLKKYPKVYFSGKDIDDAIKTCHLKLSIL